VCDKQASLTFEKLQSLIPQAEQWITEASFALSWVPVAVVGV
jgi:hypothetical protein